MGLLSAIFGGFTGTRIVNGRNPGRGWTEANRFNKAKGGFAGGYAAITFGNIMNAHCTAEDIVEEFKLDEEDCDYKHPYYGVNCYMQAYREALQEVMMDAAMMGLDPEDMINFAEVEDNAYDYAVELAEMYIGGSVWIPEDILEWAYYEISDHNK